MFSLESPHREATVMSITGYSPVKLWGNLKQIATKGFFAVMIFLDLQF